VLGVHRLLALMWLIVHSPFGKALQAIRDNETRARFVGIQIRVPAGRLPVSGVFTGIAGALWVPLQRLTTPDILYWPFSGESSSAASVASATHRAHRRPVSSITETYAVGFTVYWQALLGLVLVVWCGAPTGIVGTAGCLAAAVRRRSAQ